MGFLTAVSTALSKTFTYSGRASRSEYWWFYLALFIVGICTVFADAARFLNLVNLHGDNAILNLNIFTIATLWAFILTMPTFVSVTVRRLHDAGFSGFWALLFFVPLGGFILSILHLLPSQSSSSIHGAPATAPSATPSGKPVTADAHQRAMQGYALLFEKDKKPTAEMQAARKAEISEYYRSQVLKPAAGV